MEYEIRNHFIDGVWFSVQHLVLAAKFPTVAVDLIKEAQLTVEDCRKAQKLSGYCDEEMEQFIKQEAHKIEG